jgi:hypothetical protein
MPNSSMTRRTPGSPSPRPPYVLNPSLSARSTSGDARAAVTRHDLDTAAGFLQKLDHDLARTSEPNDVPTYLGDGSRNDREVGRPEGEARGELSRCSPRRDDVGVCCHRYAQAVVTLLSTFQQWLAQARAGLALEEMLRGAHVPLATLVPAPQRDEHRSAPVRRRLHALGGEKVLDAWPRAGAVQLRGDGARGAALPMRRRAGVDPLTS